MTRQLVGDRFDADIERMTRDGMTSPDIADRLGISARSVRRRRAALGLTEISRRIRGRREAAENGYLAPKHITAPLFSAAWWRQNTGTAASAAKPRKVAVSDIRAVAGKMFEVKKADMVGPNRAPAPSFARHVVMHVAISEFKLPIRRVAKALNRDQQVAWWANRKMRKLRAQDFDLSQKIELIAQLARKRANGGNSVMAA